MKLVAPLTASIATSRRMVFRRPSTTNVSAFDTTFSAFFSRTPPSAAYQSDGAMLYATVYVPETDRS